MSKNKIIREAISLPKFRQTSLIVSTIKEAISTLEQEGISHSLL